MYVCAEWVGFSNFFGLSLRIQRNSVMWSDVQGETHPTPSSGKYRQVLSCILRLHYPNWQHAKSVIILPKKSNFKGKKFPKEWTNLF